MLRRPEDLAIRILPILNDPEFSEIMDFTVGALVGLVRARECDFKDRPGACETNYFADVSMMVKNMVDGHALQNDFWLGGWYINSANLRIASAFHRTLKVLTGKPKSTFYVDKLVPLLPVQGCAMARLRKVHSEVNQLKHNVPSIFAGRQVGFDDALGAIQELIDMIVAHRSHLAI